MRKWLNDLRFWLVVYFIVQLPFITQPPVDRSHTWRQTLTMTVSRNLANHEGTMFYPRIDHNGATEGIIGMEFPVYNAAIAGMIRIFGFQHWYGRLINLLLSLLGVFCLSRLAEQFTDKRTAFWSGIFLLFSLWFLFMRKIMPDTLSVSMVIIGVWSGWRYLNNGKIYNAFGYLVLVSLGLLSKIPASVILAPFGMAIYLKHIPYRRKAVIVGSTFISIVLVALWYFIWVPQLVATYEYPLYFTRDLNTGLVELSLARGLIFSQFVFNSFLSYTVFALFLAGIFIASANKEKSLVLIGSVSFVVFYYFMIKTGMVFPRHNYYMVPVVPVMAVFIGYAIAHFPWKKLRPYIVAIALIESAANLHHDVIPKNTWQVGLEDKMNQFSNRSELVVCNGGVGPQMMYFLNRKGWTHRNSGITERVVDSHIQEGAKWLVLQKPYDDVPYHPITQSVYDDEYITVFPLNN